MRTSTIIAASEAKAKFSELLDRTSRGEGFVITLHGEQVAKLIPAKGNSLSEIQAAIVRMKGKRITLNPPGAAKLKVKSLINEGRR